jgi:hypothetical protein
MTRSAGRFITSGGNPDAAGRALRALNEGATVALFWDAYDNFYEHDQRMTYYGLIKNTDHIYAAQQLYHFVRVTCQ